MKIRWIIYIILTSFIIIFNVNSVYASEKSILEQGKSWVDLGKPEQGDSLGNLFSQNEKENFTQIAGILQEIGIFVIAIVGVILGIRFMFVNPEGKAKVKQAFIIYIIGSIIIISALGIWKIMISVLDVI